MANNLSKTQIDKLGDRLRKDEITEADLRLLDDYRRSFGEAYEFVVGAIRTELGLEPTGRPAKSTTSISEKLRRESMRLTQVQDIAGCRLIVLGIINQDKVVESLVELFEKATVVDRRAQPSHGYRAVHIVVSHADKLVEIQVRTMLQHLWAEQSEKLSDVIDPAIKYGGGDDPLIRRILTESSDGVAQTESLEAKLADDERFFSRVLERPGLDEGERKEIVAVQDKIKMLQEQVILLRETEFDILRKTIEEYSESTGDDDAIPD